MFMQSVSHISQHSIDNNYSTQNVKKAFVNNHHQHRLDNMIQLMTVLF